MKKLFFFFILILMLVPRSEAQINSSSDNLPKTQDKYKPKGKEQSTSTNGSKSRDRKGFDPNRLMVGGGLGLAVGSNFTSISLAPEAGYTIIPDRLIVGARFVYNYYNDRSIKIDNSSFKLHIFGGGPFARVNIWNGLFAQTEYEYTYIKDFPFLGGLQGNQIMFRDLNFNAFLLGGGYQQGFGSGFGFYFVLLFNVSGNSDFVYPNPVFRTGFTYNFTK